VFKYRKYVVLNQLKASFPNKTDAEIYEIAHDSYTNLADIIVESIKGFTMTESAYRERYLFVNPDLSLDITRNNKSVIHIAAHYGNWEWGAISYPLWLDAPVLGFYKPLSNPYIEAYGREKRSKFGMVLIPIGDTSKAFDQYEDKKSTFVFVSDQSTWSDKAHWVQFLGQDTACPPGADKYAHKLQCPVFFTDIQRVKRGYYEVNVSLLWDGMEKIESEEITRRYMKTVENIIRKKPEDWLWSHKRWKKKRNV